MWNAVRVPHGPVRTMWRATRIAVPLVGAFAAAGAVAATATRPVHLDAGSEPVEPVVPAVSVKPPVRTVVDPATKQELAAEIQADVDGKPRTLRLVGLGVRAVTFLRMYVYVAGVYVDASVVDGPLGKMDADDQDLERKFAQWMARGVPVAVRIMPVRSTDFGHLRDGLVRAVNNRAKDARAPGSAYALGDEAETCLSHNVRDLKRLFPRHSVPKGHVLDLIVWRRGASAGPYHLTLAYEGQVLGAVSSEVPDQTNGLPTFALPVQLILAYVGARPDISGPLRASVARALHEGLP